MSRQIRNAVEQARVVVVLWSADAAASDWVKSEAGRANGALKLVNVRTPGTSAQDIPSPYDQHHVNELQDTAAILRSIDAVWTGSAVRTGVPLHEIWFRQHGQRLIDPKQRTLPRNPRDIGPSELLQAPYEVVGYIDVSDVQAQFFNWCTQPGRASAGRLIHGPGGLGKTRLMVSLAARLRALGWTAGFLDRPRDSSEPALKQRWQALEQLIHHGDSDDRGLLIVIDYAEARQDEVRALARSLCERPEPPPDASARPVRLVLLARSAGEWWTTLHADTPDIQRVFRSDDPASTIELPAVSTGALRRALFDASLAAFRPWLDAPRNGSNATDAGSPSNAYLEQIETDPEFSRPLAIQMAALVSLTSARSAADATSVEELLRRVLGLERDHWRKILGDLDDDERRDLGRAVAQVALVGGTPTLESTERLLMADAFYQGRRTARVDVDSVRRHLAILYGGPNGVIVPLEPDLIAEHHVATVADKELLDGCLQWAESEAPESRERRHRYVFTVLQRAAQAEHGPQVRGRAIALLEHLVEKHALALAEAIVAVMANEPGSLLEIVHRGVARLDQEAVTSLDAALPARSLMLLDLSMSIATRRVGFARDAIALATSGEKVSNAAAERYLASSLDKLGTRLLHLGRREDALLASEEAVAIHRRLAVVDPEAFQLDRAKILNNLGVRLSNMGRREDALAAIQESVALLRPLAAARFDAVLPDLAHGLNNSGALLSSLGRHQQALASTQEAVTIYRQLVEVSPDAFLPDLATGLNSLTLRLSHMGRHEEALVAIREAVEIRGRLKATHPEAFLPELARSISVQSDVFAALGRHGEASGAAHRALELLAPFVERQRAAFGGLAGVIVKDVIKYSAAASDTPDVALIERVQRALGDANPSE